MHQEQRKPNLPKIPNEGFAGNFRGSAMTATPAQWRRVMRTLVMTGLFWGLVWVGAHWGPHDVSRPASIPAVPADACSQDGRIVSPRETNSYPLYAVLCSDGITIAAAGR